ncbi:hypothetical protein [uncultured Vagococcus sp.]|uniref:hypothetical protein n=1 Tax=uncultured Vagococcus sp. TaxID=189676 RepID=UPI0028D7FFC5|nr:hypothetical protein [uncultured Vagococcus sp.]
MNKMIKGLLVAGAVLTVASAGLVASVEADAAVKVSTSSNMDKINLLIKEKQEVVAKKKVSTDWREQKALGIRLGEIEREIAALKSGANTGNSSNSGSGITGNLTVADQIAALIKEKQEVVAKKKVSTDWREQQALGIRIGEIEREIAALKSGNQGGAIVTPGDTSGNASNETKIQELIAKKMDLVAQKKVSRDKNEQKSLGKQIDAIEKEIKQLKKNK